MGTTSTAETIGSEEHAQLRATARRFCRDRFPSEKVREVMDSELGLEPSAWAEMADLGWLGIAFPEAYGGLGFGLVEVGVLLEELGYALAAPQLFTTVACAGLAILHAGTDEQKAALLPGLADGSTRATLAVIDEGNGWGPAAVTTIARRADGGWSLSGVKRYVWDARSASLLVVAARTPADRVALFTVDAGAPGVIPHDLVALDRTRKISHVELQDAPATLLGGEDTGEEVLRRVLDLASVALACEMVGGAQWCLDTAVAYAKSRRQFGRPIGSFQAVKHRCAEMLTDVEMARSAAYSALWEVQRGGDEAKVLAPLAKAACGDAFFRVSSSAIQVHGALGYAWEHDAHLYLRRAKSTQLYLGDCAYHRELMLLRLGV
jgi:alkylation response protein AidB-like acyl-CoA dehydrogenase